MKLPSLFVICSLLIAMIACAKGSVPEPVPTKYTMVIDSSFDIDTQQAIVSGGEAWAALIEDVSFKYVVSDRRSIENTLNSNVIPEDTVYVLWADNAGTIPLDCGILDNGFGCYLSNRIYLPVVELNVSRSVQKVTSHECGHFFGLSHSVGYASVMTHELGSMAYYPTDEDITNFCAVLGCPLHQSRPHSKPSK